MFKKSNSNNDLMAYKNASASNGPHSNNSSSVLGPTLHIKGELFADEDLVIEGQVEGAIRHSQQHLTIGRQGRVKGDVTAKVITVEGVVEGNIHGEDAVMIKKTAKIIGDVRSQRVVIDDGAQFNGRIDMDNDRSNEIDNEQQRLAIDLGGGNELEFDSDNSLDADLDIKSAINIDDNVDLDSSLSKKKTETVNN